jgi:mono/diheme cytochrome c family protein
MRTKVVLGSFILFALASFLLSCNSYDEYTEDLGQDDEVEEEIAREHNGFQLLETSCFSCHNPDATATSTAAPSMAAVKQNYLMEYQSQQAFVNGMIDFVSDPNVENAIMTDAVTTYGVMPNMGFTKSQIESVANYLFETPIEQEDWFAKSYALEKAKNLVDPEDMSYVDRGFQFAMSTKSVLGKNLKGKIKSEGTDGALEFCNLNAMPLIDSMSNELDVHIRRVSDKPRNQLNQADVEQLVIIDSFKAFMEKGEEIAPTTTEKDDVVIGYYPIVTNQMCLQCHGGKDQIQASTMRLISEKYPADKAQGYAENQLRGIWVVEMKK